MCQVEITQTETVQNEARLIARNKVGLSGNNWNWQIASWNKTSNLELTEMKPTEMRVSETRQTEMGLTTMKLKWD